MVDESLIVDKILIMLHMRFDIEVSALEKIKDLDKTNMDEQHGILTTYEIRENIDHSYKKEVSFKSSKSTKKYKHTSKTISSEEVDKRFHKT